MLSNYSFSKSLILLIDMTSIDNEGIASEEYEEFQVRSNNMQGFFY